MKTDIKQLIWILSTGIGIIISMLVFENMGIGSIAIIGQEKGNSFVNNQPATQNNSTRNKSSNGNNGVTNKPNSSLQQQPPKSSTVTTTQDANKL
jgi:hypothetical protein